MPRRDPPPIVASIYVPGVVLLVGGSAASPYAPRLASVGQGVGLVLCCAGVAMAMGRRGAKDPPRRVAPPARRGTRGGRHRGARARPSAEDLRG